MNGAPLHVHAVNPPDSAELRQLDGHWQRMCGLLMWKLTGRDVTTTVTMADLQAMQASFGDVGAVVLVHAHEQSVDFRLVTVEQANAAAADAEKAGHG